jgi:hypothetical protein
MPVCHQEYVISVRQDGAPDGCEVAPGIDKPDVLRGGGGNLLGKQTESP